jgi:hypothetical protein
MRGEHDVDVTAMVSYRVISDSVPPMPYKNQSQ